MKESSKMIKLTAKASSISLMALLSKACGPRVFSLRNYEDEGRRGRL